MTLRPAKSIPSIVSRVAAAQTDELTVGGYLPLRHPAFARVMNPIVGPAGSLVSWASLAGPDVTVGATTGWNDLRDHALLDQPQIGSIDRTVGRSLARILRAHTSTPDRCFFLVWEGYRGGDDDFQGAARITIEPDRVMLILSGQIEDASRSVETPPPARTAQWWLPEDGAWAVGNDIYGASVYVGGSDDAVADILAAGEIESYRAAAGTLIIAEEFEWEP